jgi:methionyl-tRNA synthetase
VLLGGERFSKSAGVQLDLDEASDGSGQTRSDTSCCAKYRSTTTAAFSWERFEERYNADLANALGNLASRTISMVERYLRGRGAGGAAADADGAGRAGCAGSRAVSSRRWTDRAAFSCTKALRHVWSTVRRGNEYVDTQAPWKLAKDPALRGELERTLAVSCDSSRANAIHPPIHCRRRARRLALANQPGHQRALGINVSRTCRRSMSSGWQSRKGSGRLFFPKRTATTETT